MLYLIPVASAFIFGVSQALLLPHDVSNENEALIKTISFQHEKQPLDEWVIVMDYPRTPGFLNSMSDIPFSGAKSILELNFTVQADQLMLNEFPIYPVRPMSQATIEPLTVPYLTKSDRITWEYVSAANLGYAVTELNHPQYSKQKDVEPISINVDIFEADGLFFEKIQTIEVQLLNVPSGKLGIQLAEISAPKPQNLQISGDKEKCDFFLCKVETGFSKLLSKAKNVVKKPCHNISQLQRHHGHKIPATPHPNKLQPHHSHENMIPHAHHPYPHLDVPQRIIHNIEMESFFQKTIVPYLVPTIIGILAGIAAGLTGMLFGYAAIYVWSVLCRRHSDNYTMIQQSDDMEQGTYRDLPSSNQFPGTQQDSITITSEKN